MYRLLNDPTSSAAQSAAVDSTQLLRAMISASTDRSASVASGALTTLAVHIAVLADPNQTMVPPGTVSQLSGLVMVVDGDWSGAQIALRGLDAVFDVPPPTSTRAS